MRKLFVILAGLGLVFAVDTAAYANTGVIGPGEASNLYVGETQASVESYTQATGHAIASVCNNSGCDKTVSYTAKAGWFDAGCGVSASGNRICGFTVDNVLIGYHQGAGPTSDGKWRLVDGSECGTKNGVDVCDTFVG